MIPVTPKGINALEQRLKALVTSKNEESANLRVAHSTSIDQLHISYGIEHAKFVEENSRPKDELVKTQATFETERSSNSVRQKSLVELLSTGPPSFSVLPFA